MRPRPCWIVLHVSTLAGLLLASDGEDSACGPEIRVRRGTKYTVSAGQELKIPCGIVFCNGVPPTVSWARVNGNSTKINISSNGRIKIEWEKLNETEGISYLFLHDALQNDSGRYECSAEQNVGHHIEVTVTGDGEIKNGTQRNGTKSVGSDHTDTWMYVYSTAGIVAFVVVVIVISVASMWGCKGKSRKETQTECQVVMMPVAKQPLNRQSPRGSPTVPPPRRSTKRKTPSRQSAATGAGEEPTTAGDRGRQRDRVEEEPEGGAALVYAALHHQLPARGGARPQRPAEETSEYAAIRVA